MNCWEYKKCGREEGGGNAAKLGVCPSSTDRRLDGIHGGRNAGRACWVVAGTFCGEDVKCTFADNERSCQDCDFYRLVRRDEAEKGSFRISLELLEMLAA